MDEFDYVEQTRSGKRIFAIIWNLLTILTLLTTACLIAAFSAIFLNPRIIFNPFPPPSLPTAMEMPTLTPTALSILPPTWTPTATLTPTETPPPPPTPTQSPTDTPQPLFTPTETLTSTLASSAMTFALSEGSPIAISNLAFHPEAGCNWMGIAGQVLNLSGAPISTGVSVRLGGVLAGNQKDITSLSGTATQYGDAGYEIVLASKPIASNGTLWLQLFDQGGLPLSEQLGFDTFDSCDKNLIIINFRQAY